MNKPVYALSKVARAGLTNVSFLAVQSLLFILMTPLILRFLGEDAFGVWIIISSIIGFSRVANFKLGVSASKYIAQYINEPDSSAAVSNVVSINYLSSFAMGCAATIVLFAIRPWLAGSIDSITVTSETLHVILTYIAMSILPIFLSEISIGILFGLLRYGIGNSIILGQQILTWTGVLIIGRYDLDFVYVGLLLFIIALIRFLLAGLIAYRLLTPSFVYTGRIDRLILEDISSFVIMNWLGSVGMLIFNSLDKVLVGITLGATTAGVYGLGTGIGLRMSQFIDQATQALIPYASNLGSSRNFKKLSVIFQGAQRLTATLIALIFTGLIIWMPQILAVWITPDYAMKYALVFRILILSYGLFSLSTPAYKISTGLGWVKIPNTIILSTAGVMILILYFASLQFGLTGAILSNFIFAGLLLINIYTAHKLNEHSTQTFLKSIGSPIGLFWIFSLAGMLNETLLFSFILFAAFLTVMILSQKASIAETLQELNKSLKLMTDLSRTSK